MKTRDLKKFINELRIQGIDVEKLSLMQVSESLKLYRMINQ